MPGPLSDEPPAVHRRRPGSPGARVRRDWPRYRWAGGEIPSTGILADAMHRLGAMAAAIEPVWPEARPAGLALTVWVRAGDNALIQKAIGLAAPGDVLVVNAQGLLTHAVFGELMARACRSRGIAGMVVDGKICDAALAALRFPTFARDACASGPLKDDTGEIGCPIACGGVVCVAGDLVLGDGDGMVVVPGDRMRTRSAHAAEILAWEGQRRAALGSPPVPVDG